MGTYAEVTRFLDEHRLKYTTLLKDLKFLIHTINESCEEPILFLVYSRADKQKSNDEFKDTKKIVKKIQEWRKDKPNTQLYSLHDIVGLTAVVYYPDEINNVYKFIKDQGKLNKLKIYTYDDNKDSHNFSEYGYHGLHMILGSTKPDLINIRAELQIKTVLHEAWGSKTHDLTYKPNGELNEKHKSMMEGFGDSIQSLEVQSQILRDLIRQDWFTERDLRHAARIAMASALKSKKFENQELQQLYREAYSLLEANKDKIKNCDRSESILVTLHQKIETIKEFKDSQSIEAAWPLMLLFASMRLDNLYNNIAELYITEWLESQTEASLKAHFKTSFFHAIGERQKAIDLTEQYLNAQEISNDIKATLKHNLLSYLIEEASLAPKNYIDIKRKCECIYEELLQDKKELTPAEQDTKGAFKIMFGKSEEEIEKGIRMCQSAYPSNTQVSDDPGILYARLHERIGWRKILKNI